MDSRSSYVPLSQSLPTGSGYSTSGYVPSSSSSNIFSLQKSSYHINWKYVLIAVVILLVLLFIYNVYRSYSVGAKLQKKGWVLYSMQGCSKCTQQKAMLCSKFTNIINTDGKGNQLPPTKKGKVVIPPLPLSQVKQFPTWVNGKTGEVKVGLQSESSLLQMAK